MCLSRFATKAESKGEDFKYERDKDGTFIGYKALWTRPDVLNVEGPVFGKPYITGAWIHEKTSVELYVPQ